MKENEAPKLREQSGASDRDNPRARDRHMAAEILPAATHLATQYKLPEQDRTVILAQAPGPRQQPLAKTTAEIERQRREFTAMYGCPFGTVPAEDQ